MARRLGFRYQERSAYTSTAQDDLGLGKVKLLKGKVRENREDIIGGARKLKNNLTARSRPYTLRKKLLGK